MKTIKFKRITALLMIMVLISLTIPTDLFSTKVYANDNNGWDGVSVKVPELNESEYIIDSAEELAWFSQEVNNGNTFEGNCIFITGNINLDNKGWTAIGNGTKDNPTVIKGKIIINNANILGLTNSLFGNVKVSSVQIDNLKMQDVDMSSARGAAGFVFSCLEIGSYGVVDIRNSEFSGEFGVKAECGVIAGYVNGINDNTILNITNCDIDVDSSKTDRNSLWEWSSKVKGGLFGTIYAPANEYITH